MSKIKSLTPKSIALESAAISITDNVELNATSEGNTPANTPIEQTRWNGWGNVNINKKVSPHGANKIDQITYRQNQKATLG